NLAYPFSLEKNVKEIHRIKTESANPDAEWTVKIDQHFCPDGTKNGFSNGDNFSSEVIKPITDATLAVLKSQGATVLNLQPRGRNTETIRLLKGIRGAHRVVVVVSCNALQYCRKAFRSADDELVLEALSVLTASGRIGPVPSSSIEACNEHVTSQPTVGKKGARLKQYAQKACAACKNSHVACDAGRPCQRCIRLRRADSCTDASRKKRGRPSNVEKAQKLPLPPLSLGAPLLPPRPKAPPQSDPFDTPPILPPAPLTKTHHKRKRKADPESPAASAHNIPRKSKLPPSSSSTHDPTHISPLPPPALPTHFPSSVEWDQTPHAPLDFTHLPDFSMIPPPLRLDDPTAASELILSAPSHHHQQAPRSASCQSDLSFLDTGHDRGGSVNAFVLPGPEMAMPDHRRGGSEEMQMRSVSVETAGGGSSSGWAGGAVGAFAGGFAGDPFGSVSGHSSGHLREDFGGAVGLGSMGSGGHVREDGSGGGMDLGGGSSSGSLELGGSSGELNNDHGNHGLSEILQQLMRGIFGSSGDGCGNESAAGGAGSGGGGAGGGGSGCDELQQLLDQSESGGGGGGGGMGGSNSSLSENHDMMQAVNALSMLLPEELAKALTSKFVLSCWEFCF
ncbi:hypothetical protein HDU98_004687, partial [Podochytrium sp. JEL0797]